MYSIIEETERQVRQEVSSNKCPGHDRRIHRYTESYDLGQTPSSRKRQHGQSRSLKGYIQTEERKMHKRKIHNLQATYPRITPSTSAQNDPGANRSVTSDRSLLYNLIPRCSL